MRGWTRSRSRFPSDAGATAIEYGLILAGVSAAALLSLNALGPALQSTYLQAVGGPGLATCASGVACDAFGVLPDPSVTPGPTLPATPTPTSTASAPAWPTAAPCAPVDLGTQNVVRGQTFTTNVFTLADPDVTGSPTLSTASASGDTSGEGTGATPWTWNPNGVVTWTSPNSNGKKVTFTLTYRAGSCAGSSTITMRVQTKNA